MNLDRLRRLQGRERKKEDLCDLEDGFFEQARSYLGELEERAAEDPRALDELRNARRAVQGLFDRRLRKILGMVAASTAKVDIDMSPMVPEERELFAELRASLEEHSRILERPTNNNKEGDEEKEDSDLKVVRVLEAVDDFVGTDGLRYRLREDDVVALPAQSADVLIEMNAAEEIR